MKSHDLIEKFMTRGDVETVAAAHDIATVVPSEMGQSLVPRLDPRSRHDPQCALGREAAGEFGQGRGHVPGPRPRPPEEGRSAFRAEC